MSENRYAPPTSAVADFESASPSQPLARPRSVIYGIRMLWAQLALGIPGLAFQMITLSQDAQAIGQTAVVLFFMALAAFLNHMSWRGRNWARICT